VWSGRLAQIGNKSSIHFKSSRLGPTFSKNRGDVGHPGTSDLLPDRFQWPHFKADNFSPGSVAVKLNIVTTWMGIDAF
jgi:hypothetical protein